MAEQDIPQNLIARLGQSQHDRHAPALDVHFADIDERSIEDFLRTTKDFAKWVRYYEENPSTSVATWEKFFSYAPSTISQLISNDLGNVSPHLALFCTFLHLCISIRIWQDLLRLNEYRHVRNYNHRACHLRVPKHPKKHEMINTSTQQATTN